MKTWFWVCSYCHDMIPIDIKELNVDLEKLGRDNICIQNLDEDELSPSHIVVRDHYVIYHGVSKEGGGMIEGGITDVEEFVN